MSAVSRQEYVKRYQSSEKPKKKLKDTAASSSNGRGMRLLDEDTFIQQKGRDKLHRKMAEEEDGENDDDFDEDEEELDEIEQAIRRLNRKSSTKNSKKNNGNPGPAFKTDSFVDVQGDDLMEQPGSSAPTPTASDRVKTEVKEELQSEGEEEDQRSKKKGNRMGDGRRTGLVSKQVMVEEIQQNDKKEAGGDGGQQSESTAPAETRKRVTGFNRDARKRRKEDETEDQVAEKEARKAREAAKQTELEQKYASWNHGVAQIRERADRLEDMEQTLGEGFARYADNQAMNEKLREQLHDDDPMADYFRLKNHKVQMRTGVVYPTYKGQVPPNRYGIQPGYRWDGVDRSNGFESKMALEKNKQKAHAELTYRSIHECE